MKKIIFILTFCVAGFFSAKAQSSADSAYARDLVYQPLNTSTLPVSVKDTLLNSDKILKDVREGRYAKGYSFTSTKENLWIISMLSGGWDCYLYLLDANFEIVDYNDDYNGSGNGSRIVAELPAGTYYVIATSFSSGVYGSDRSYTLILNAINAKKIRELTYTPQTFSMFTDSVTYADAIVYDSVGLDQWGDPILIEMNRVKAYTMHIPAGHYMFYDTNWNVSMYNVSMYILDNEYNFIGYSEEGIQIDEAGTYRILVASWNNFDADTTLTDVFTFNVETLNAVTYKTLTYSPINTGVFIVDSLTADDPILFPSVNNLSYVKGYQFTTSDTANYIMINVNDSVHSIIVDYTLLDNNKNVIKEDPYLLRVTPSTTYYFVVYGDDPFDQGFYNFVINEKAHLNTYFIDAINGNDNNNGLSVDSAFRTLDAAVYMSNGVGTYYLTENYVFTDYVEVFFAEIYPYGKNIHLSEAISNSNYDYVIGVAGELTFGKKGDTNYFILDTALNNPNYETFITYGRSFYPDADIEINNVIMNNFEIRNFVEGTNVTVNNCKFTDNYIYAGRYMPVMFYATDSLKFSNTLFSQNTFEGMLFTLDNQMYRPMPTVKKTFFEMENTDILSNYFGMPIVFYEGANVNLKSGNIRNNSIEMSNGSYGFYEIISLFDINPTSAAGVWMMGGNITMGSDFKMDNSNYLFLDSSVVLTITEDIRQPEAATIFPFSFNPYAQMAMPRLDYYDGRLVLGGTESLVAANYSRFAIAQPLNEIWLLHSDGRIYKSGLGIEDEMAGNNEIRIYPNPAKDQVTIDGIENTENIQLINMMGQVVKQFNHVNESVTVNVSELPAGMYFVRMGNTVKKLMVE